MWKKPNPNSNSAPPTATCQKCLHKGHYTYQCKNDRPYKPRPTRTQQLLKPGKREEPSVQVPEEFLNSGKGTAAKILEAKRKEREALKSLEESSKKKKRSSSSSSSSDSSDSSDSDSSGSDSGDSSSSSDAPRRRKSKKRYSSDGRSPSPKRRERSSDSEDERPRC